MWNDSVETAQLIIWETFYLILATTSIFCEYYCELPKKAIDSYTQKANR